MNRTRACSAAWSASRELAAGDGPVGRVPQHAPAPLDAGLAALDRDDVHAVAREHLHDARTHGAQSDHADECEVPCHARSLSEPPDAPGGMDRESVVTLPLRGSRGGGTTGDRITGC